MNFQNIVKEEWEKEFISQIGEYEGCMLQVYESLLERVCKRVWNQALEVAANSAMIEEEIPEHEVHNHGYESPSIHSGGYIRNEHYVQVNKESILKHKL